MENNFCKLSVCDIHEKIKDSNLTDYNLGGLITIIRLSDSIFSEGIIWGKKITFKLKSSLN